MIRVQERHQCASFVLTPFQLLLQIAKICPKQVLSRIWSEQRHLLFRRACSSTFELCSSSPPPPPSPVLSLPPLSSFSIFATFLFLHGVLLRVLLGCLTLVFLLLRRRDRQGNGPHSSGRQGIRHPARQRLARRCADHGKEIR